MDEVICKLSVFVPGLGVILWTGASEQAIKTSAARKYASMGLQANFGEPRYVLR